MFPLSSQVKSNKFIRPIRYMMTYLKPEHKHLDIIKSKKYMAIYIIYTVTFQLQCTLVFLKTMLEEIIKSDLCPKVILTTPVSIHSPLPPPLPENTFTSLIGSLQRHSHWYTHPSPHLSTPLCYSYKPFCLLLFCKKMIIRKLKNSS